MCHLYWWQKPGYMSETLKKISCQISGIKPIIQPWKAGASPTELTRQHVFLCKFVVQRIRDGFFMIFRSDRDEHVQCRNSRDTPKPSASQCFYPAQDLSVRSNPGHSNTTSQKSPVLDDKGYQSALLPSNKNQSVISPARENQSMVVPERKNSPFESPEKAVTSPGAAYQQNVDRTAIATTKDTILLKRYGIIYFLRYLCPHRHMLGRHIDFAVDVCPSLCPSICKDLCPPCDTSNSLVIFRWC